MDPFNRHISKLRHPPFDKDPLWILVFRLFDRGIHSIGIDPGWDRECVDGGEWTFENLNAATTWSSDQERRECTTKAYERTLYQNYKTRINRQVERLRGQAMELKRNLEAEIEDVRDRQNYLRLHYNL